MQGSPLAVCLDFDGTIVRPDTIRLLAELGMGPLRARKLSDEVDRRRVSVRDAIARMVGSVTTTLDVGMAYLEARARLDPGFAPLLDWAAARRAPVHVVSAGLEPVLRRFLGAHASRVVLHANDLVVDGDGDDARWRAVFRDGRPAEAGKLGTVERLLAAGHAVAYAGDGLGDLEAARRVATAERPAGAATRSRVFARDVLAAEMASAGLPFTPFDTLDDVRRVLDSA
jgi:HAD superfamily phosphoserine phosphatase-like hydrolase